ncbi:hypothetical protein FA95DRAFT_1680916 [Auriscalpium vulgare]|uniref:Uncharacterized protein n=1 Tax=Auriscalpium vulgare TaxID=40419 RepID=A0ACB8RL35_9AGAM|nr:hypothetical protein FA95DRAFT_1680916 [Auriscalpium vulgare]
MALRLYACLHTTAAFFSVPSPRQCGRRFFTASRILPRIPWHAPFYIQTLDPSKLIPSDFVDLSGRNRVTYNARLADNSRIRTANALYYEYALGDNATFPTDTRGFLYFHAPSREVRFRLLASNDPRHFAKGTDLALPSGEAWCLKTAVLATRARAAGFRALLVQDGVRMDALASSSHGAQLSLFQRRKHIRRVTRLGETFPVRFNLKCMHLAVGTPVTLVPWQSPFKWSVQPEDSGQAQIALERSPLPEHRGRRVLVLRVHQISGNPQLRPEMKAFPHHHLYMPREGSLVYRKMKGNGLRPEPWAYDIDAQRRSSDRARKIFRELWDRDEGSDNTHNV